MDRRELLISIGGTQQKFATSTNYAGWQNPLLYISLIAAKTARSNEMSLTKIFILAKECAGKLIPNKKKEAETEYEFSFDDKYFSNSD